MPTAGTGEAATQRRGDVPSETTVLVVDDQRTFADAVALAVDSQRQLRCVGAVGSAEEAFDCIGTRCPDVVLLDVRLPGMDGLTAISLLKQRCPAIRILVLTANDSQTRFLAAAAAGADGFLPKDTPFTEIIDAVRSTDTLLVDPNVIRQIAHGGLAPAEPGDPSERRVELTDRELEVLRLLADGVPVKQIAPQLGVTVHTCRGHVRSILHKLDAHSQLAAVVTAARLGLLDDLGQ
jgi:DNA-binding NarL/FixJ family response regulator